MVYKEYLKQYTYVVLMNGQPNSNPYLEFCNIKKTVYTYVYVMYNTARREGICLMTMLHTL